MTEAGGFVDEQVPDESEQLDQLQPADSLVDRGVEDVLDEGYAAPDRWSAAQGFGNTVEEMRRGETLAQRMKQELPEPDAVPQEPWNVDGEDREVGGRRAGRLVFADGPDRQDTIGFEVGLGGGAACAEEAAMHIIGEDDDDLDD